MSELLLKIYQYAISDEEDALEMRKRIDDWITQLIKPHQDKLNNRQVEELRDLMYASAIKAEEESFQLGVKYALKLMLKLF